MLTDSAEFHEEATAQYDAAFDWYLEQSPDAALKFDAEVDRALAHILQAPQRWTAGPHSIAEEAAALMESLANNHGFLDGKKRITFIAGDGFLRRTGFYIEVEGSEEGYAFIYESMDRHEFRFGQNPRLDPSAHQTVRLSEQLTQRVIIESRLQPNEAIAPFVTKFFEIKTLLDIHTVSN